MGLLKWIALAAAGGGLLKLASRTTAVGRAVDAGKLELFRGAVPSRSREFIDDLWRVGQETGISPVLLWAIMEWESRSSTALSPPGPAGTGDGGHGRGLMQIDDRYHGDWLATNEWWVPLRNIRKGAEIFQGNVRFFQARPGNSPMTVKGTVIGAGGDVRDPRPLADPLLTAASLAAYNAGPGNVLRAIALGLDHDSPTTPYKQTNGQEGYSRRIIASAMGVEAKIFGA